MESSLTKYAYPDYFVKHPDIGHIEMTQKVFKHLEPERLDFSKYMYYHQMCYMILCQNFEEYLAYLDDEYWNQFRLESMKKRTKIITI